MANPGGELITDLKVQAVLRLLHAAREGSRMVACDPAVLAIPDELLHRTGCSSGQLLALAEASLIEESEEGYWLTNAGAVIWQKHAVPACEPDEAGPCWVRRSRTLLLNGKLVRKLPTHAERQVKLLDAFHKANWNKEIRNPFGNTSNGIQQLRGAVRGLLIAQQVLEFTVGNGGRTVSWGGGAIINILYILYKIIALSSCGPGGAPLKRFCSASATVTLWRRSFRRQGAVAWLLPTHDRLTCVLRLT